jgi:hypothetical protein
MCVRVRGDREVPLADLLADPRPWDAAEMEQSRISPVSLPRSVLTK